MCMMLFALPQTLWCHSVGYLKCPLSLLLLMCKLFQLQSFQNTISLFASPSFYWEVWRSPVWLWTFSSCSSIPFFCAAGETKVGSRPMLTAAAPLGASSLQHLSAGEFKSTNSGFHQFYYRSYPLSYHFELLCRNPTDLITVN